MNINRPGRAPLGEHNRLPPASTGIPISATVRRRVLCTAAVCASSAIAVAGCGGSTADVENPAHASTQASTAPARGPGVGADAPAGSATVRRVTRKDCKRAGPISASRVSSNPKARRVGAVVFTPLALSRSIKLQPEGIAGAPGARSIKIGATVISGGPSTRVAISAPGGARLLYGAELIESLADGSLRWSALPRSIVFVRCREGGGARATAFPGGFILRRANTCVRLRVTDSKGRSAARSFAFGRHLCGRR